MESTRATRASGILLHVTSLAGPHGIGDLGAAAYALIDQLVHARQGIWQVLPLGPTSFADSPYQSVSAFAGSPLLIDLADLVQRGWLAAEALADPPPFASEHVDYEQVTPWKIARLRQAFAGFQATASLEDRARLEAFCEQSDFWLADFALFQALKDHHGGVEWTRWPAELRSRDAAALNQWSERLAGEIQLHRFSQWCFFRQWLAVRQYANARGVRIVGDVPIFVAHDSADVWAHRSLFLLDDAGLPTVVAGVPPDYFSATGQLWGNPLYDWRQAATDGYAWWLRRFAQATLLFDLVRLDHFRGFVAHWEIPYGAAVAALGRWAPGPGAALLTAATAQLGPLPLIAEDLGVITPAVEALRDKFELPGMRILQFAFGTDPMAPLYRPHNFIPNCVAYTGTHDNDTTVGWFRSEAGEGTTRTADEIERERAQALHYLGSDGREIEWDFIRLAMASVARLAVFPMQDVLGLGTGARMNMPSTTHGNWRWRMQPGEFTQGHQQRLRAWAETFERDLFSPTGEEEDS